MKIVLDRPRCEGHGLCEEAAPALLHLDDDGELVLDRTRSRRAPPRPRPRAPPCACAPWPR